MTHKIPKNQYNNHKEGFYEYKFCYNWWRFKNN